MNDQDKEAFEKWKLEYISTHTGYFKMIGTDDLAQVAWQAACRHKQKEIDELEESLATRLAKSYIAGKDLSKIIQKNLTNEVKKLQAENAKLRECVEFYADSNNYNCCDSWSVYWYVEDEQDEVGKRARQVLNELGDNMNDKDKVVANK